MGRKIWFLTGNEGKVKEVSHHLGSKGYEVKQLVIDVEISEPQADDLATVASSKIQQALPHLPHPDDMLLVEDAGLFVEGLNGFPGVYSAYVLKTIGCQGILDLMHYSSDDPVQAANLRKAEFRACAALLANGEITYGHGVCKGHISDEIKGENGFGFDPIFIPLDLDSIGNSLEPGVYGDISTHGSTFGEISIDDKKKFSHRARAIEDLMSKIPPAQ